MFETMPIWLLIMALVFMMLAVVYFTYWKIISYLFMTIAGFLLIVYAYRVLFTPYNVPVFMETDSGKN